MQIVSRIRHHKFDQLFQRRLFLEYGFCKTEQHLIRKEVIQTRVHKISELNNSFEIGGDCRQVNI